MNATLSPISDSTPFTAANTPPMQAGYTGGASGTPSYSWAFDGPVSGVPGPGNTITSFLNPLNASSQIVRFASMPGIVGDRTYTQPVTVTVTDAAGHTSSQDATATMTRTG